MYFSTISRTSAPDPYRVVEAFCAYLPDLSIELDAITQRREAGFLSARAWTTSEECRTPEVKNMVTTQFYLHGLTGSATAPVRQAAKAMIADIDADLAKNAGFNPATATLEEKLARVNLWCERGFAGHLLGDTYAHSKLKDPTKLYSPGMGHASAGRTPDRMLSRDEKGNLTNLWVDWVEEIYTTLLGLRIPLAARTQFENMAARFKSLPNYGEEELVAELRVGPDAWNIYPKTRPLSVWGAVGFKRLFAPANCQAQIDAGPAADPNGAGGPSAYGVRPNCATVWTQYLGRALNHFGNIKPSEASCQTTDPAQAPLGGIAPR